jgi:hypothetical protein
MDLKTTGFEDADWIQLDQHRLKWQAYDNETLGSIKGTEFLH